MPLFEVESRSINGGRVTGLPPYQLGIAESPDTENTDPTDVKGATTRPGSSLYQSMASAGSGARGVGLYPWVRNNGTSYYFAAFATTIFSLDGTTSLSVKTGMATDSLMMAVPLNNMLAVFASGLRPQISSAGSTLASITAGTFLPTQARIGAPYASRVWCAGDTANPNTIYSCAVNNPEDWSTVNNAASIVVGDGDGDKIKGLSGSQSALYILKRNNLYALLGTSPFDYLVKKVRQVGVVSDYGYASDGEGCFFASDDGIYYAVGMNIARLSDPIFQDYKDVSDKSTMALEVKGDKLFCFYKASGSENNAAFVLAYMRKMPTGEVKGVWGKYTSQPYQVAKTSSLNALYGLTNASTLQLYQLDTGSSGAVTGTWNTPDMDYGDPMAVKKLARYYIHISPPLATTTLTVRWFANGASIGSDVDITIGTTSSYAMPQRGPQSAGTITGNYLRMRLTWSGQMTVYGFKTYAEMEVSGDLPRR